MIPLFLSASDLDELRRRHVNVLKTAIQRSYGSLQAGCVDMGVKPQNFDQALNGDRGLPVGFFQLNAKCLAWYGVGLIEEFGIPVEVRRAAKAMLGVLGFRRMAKAQLPADRTARIA